MAPIYYCPLCRMALSFMGDDHPGEWGEGHWYGCSHCGRKLCRSCGIQLGRRCDRCRGTLEYDRYYPLRLIPDGDWRDFLPHYDEDFGVWRINEELIAYASAERVEAILAAIPSDGAAEFWDEVLAWEVRRRLGVLDELHYLRGPTIRLDEDWQTNLARLAAAGLAGRSEIDEAAMALRLRIFGWAMLGCAVAGIIDELEQALGDGRPWLVDVVLDCVAMLELTRAELMALIAARLVSGDPSLRNRGLRTLVSARSQSRFAPRFDVELAAVALVVDALPELGAERIVDAAFAVELPGCGLSIVDLCRALGLGAALDAQFSEQVARGDRRSKRLVRQLRKPETESDEALVDELDEQGDEDQDDDPELDEGPSEEQIAEALTWVALGRPLDPRLESSPRYRAAFEARRPRLLLEVQRGLAAERNSWRRASMMTTLGCLRAEPGDGAEALLVTHFEDQAEPYSVREAAAQALVERPIAEHHRERLLASTTDPRPMIRAWALRLVDDPSAWMVSKRDTCELVKHLARQRPLLASVAGP